ncbi:hypothetical protein [Nonomuraea longicatena]|uniref:Uncharacterized protein n=1 Tax=Nonomuraea longicatena TaxID=83682 RepID=A0ABP3ZUF2_9ACTN
MADALLHYSTSTSPSPLQAGSSDKPTSNTINLTVTAPSGQQVYCDKIDVALPASAPEGGGAYFTAPPTGTITGGNWKPPPAQLKSGKELGLSAAANYYHVVFEPPIPELDLVDSPLSFAISGELASTAAGGSLGCAITETSGTSSGSYSRKDRLDLTLPTAEPVFFLHSLLAVAPDKPTLPRTRFAAGAEVTLSWESSGTSFQVFDGDGNSLYEGVATTCSIPASKLVCDTTFTVKASLVSTSQPANLYATLTLTVVDPTLSRMNITGELVTADLTVPHKLSTTQTDGLRVSGSMTADSALYANGQLSTRSVSVGGDLTVSGDLTAARSLTVRGKANLESLMARAERLQPTLDGSDIPVYGDGIMLVFADIPGRYVATFAVMDDGSNDSAFEVGMWDSDRVYTIPLRNGQRWRLDVSPDHPRFTFYWFSFS